MLTKFIPVARTAANVARLQSVRSMGGAVPAWWKTDKEIAMDQKSHMNFLPVPEGSWQENHNKRNSKWNMQLGGAIAFFVVSIVCMVQTNCWYLHDMPPMKNK